MKKLLFLLLPLLFFVSCGKQAEQTGTCFVSVLCDTAISSPDCDPAVREILPADGVILAETEISVFDNDSVFDVLSRACREQKIPLEHSKTPLTNAVYIEGISNLYEFDCGPTSGWMFSLNGDFPPCSCSDVTVKPGDTVVIRYSCSLGHDIGGDYASQKD